MKPKRKKRMHIVLSDNEYEILHEHAIDNNLSMSEVLREYIKSLPKKKEELSSCNENAKKLVAKEIKLLLEKLYGAIEE